MLIDDNKIDIFINEKVIGKYDPHIKIIAFNDAISALSFFELFEMNVPSPAAPQLILLDINMPELDGFGFFQRFKALKVVNQYDISVFMLSSSSCPDDVRKAQSETCCAGYIMKPLTIDKLKNACNQVEKLKYPRDFKKIF